MGKQDGIMFSSRIFIRESKVVKAILALASRHTLFKSDLFLLWLVTRIAVPNHIGCYPSLQTVSNLLKQIKIDGLVFYFMHFKQLPNHLLWVLIVV